MSPDELEELEQALQLQLIRSDFREFVRFLAPLTRWQPWPHSVRAVEILHRILDRVPMEQGAPLFGADGAPLAHSGGAIYRNAMLLHSVGSGKSLLARLAGLYQLLKWSETPVSDPSVFFIAVNVQRAAENLQAMLDVVNAPVWPGPAVSGTFFGKEHWQLASPNSPKPEAFAIAPGAATLGRRYHTCFIDDITQPNQQMQPVLDFLQNVLFGRATLDGSQLICTLSRQSMGDSVDVLRELLGEEAFYIDRIPALAEADDPLGRSEGDCLWRPRKPASTHDEIVAQHAADLAEVQALRKRTSERVFSAQWQQSPLPAPGARLFDRVALEGSLYGPGRLWPGVPKLKRYVKSELTRATRIGIGNVPGTTSTIYTESPAVCVWDLNSGKGNEGNDDAIGLVMRYTRIDGVPHFFVDAMHCFNAWQVTDLALVCKLWRSRYTLHGPVLLEDASGANHVAKGLGQLGVPAELMGFGKGSKAERAKGWSWIANAGHLHFVKDGYETVPIAKILNQFEAMPFGPHEDIVDAVGLGIQSQLTYVDPRTQSYTLVHQHDTFKSRLRQVQDELLAS